MHSQGDTEISITRIQPGDIYRDPRNNDFEIKTVVTVEINFDT
jgi:hypothetical protein